MFHNENSKHHNKLLRAWWIVAILATLLTIWQWYQLPHEAFPVRNQKINTTGQKKPQPQMPVTDDLNQ